MKCRLPAVIEREDDGYVALSPEPVIASQGDSLEAARDKMHEVLELFFECASFVEVTRRLTTEVYVPQIEVAVR
jgi:predicted RNase H-like HicB family nuclease